MALAESKERFWWGPITSDRMARRIIDVTSWVFILFGSLAAISELAVSFQPGQSPPFAAALFTLLLLVVPAGFLISRKVRAPAVILMAVTGLIGLVSMLTGVVILNQAEGALAIVAGLLLPAIWLVLFVLGWRSFRAASALRRLKAGAAMAKAGAEVFD